MPAFRPFLIWMLCALLGCAGQPVRQAPPCEAAGAASACCDTGSCCCEAQASSECGCTAPARAPLPEPPAPKQPLGVDGPAPLQQQVAAVPPSPRLDRARASALPEVLLANRSRQVALSVWRL